MKRAKVLQRATWHVVVTILQQINGNPPRIAPRTFALVRLQIGNAGADALGQPI
jgi:hypothetical protein